MSFLFSVDGVDIGQIVTITNVDRGFVPELTHDIKTYSKKDGGYYGQFSRFEGREVTVEYVVRGDIDRKKYLLQRALVKNQELKLIFGDEPDRYFSGRLIGRATFEKVTRSYARGSWTFLCFYPFALSTSVKQATRKQNRLEFINQGTVKVWPVYEFLVGSALKMIAFSHPNGRVVQYGYESGGILLQPNDRVVFDSGAGILTVNGVRKYINPASRWFAIEPGTTEVGVSVHVGGQVPSVTARFREAYL